MSAEQLANEAAARESLDQAIAVSSDGTVPQQLLALADLLRENPALTRALTDTGRSTSDREALATSLCGGHCSPEVLSVLTTAVKQHWTHPTGLVDTLDAMGIEAYLKEAQAHAQLRLVESELFAVRTLLREQRDLRIQLSPLGQGTGPERADLIGDLLGDKVHPTTKALVERAVQFSSHGRLLQTLRGYARTAAEISGTRLVTVSVAQPLTGAQRERLKNLVERQLGEPVSLAVAVDPDLVGGFRINYGDEAVDSSVRSDIAAARRALVR